MEKAKNNQSLASARDKHGATLGGVKNDVHELKGMTEDVLSSVNEFAQKTERRPCPE